MERAIDNNKNYRFFDLIVGLFVAVLLISNIASTKIVDIWRFTFDGGTILFPLSYIFGDILTEVYGYRQSRRAIWIGFLSALMMSVVLGLIGLIRPAEGWELQEAYMSILGQTPRIVTASLIAYFIGEFSNSYIMARMKVLTEGKWLAARTITSTIAGQGIDTIIFVFIAFFGVYSNSLLMAIIISNYVFKVLMEVAFTPLTYKIVNGLKRVERVDYYDRGTDFNPFKFFK